MAILITFLSPIIGFIYFFKKNIFENVNVLYSALLFGCVFGFLGYSITLTNSNADLARYVYWMAGYNGISFQSIIYTAIQSKDIFVVQKLLLKFFSLTQNTRLFTAFIAFVFYSGLGYIYFSFIRNNKLENRNRKIFVLTALLLISFGWVLTNVRNPMADSLIAVAIYRDLYLKKINFSTIFFYLVSISMHVAVIPILIVRLIIGIFCSKKISGKIFAVVISAGTVILSLQTNMVSSVLSKVSVYGIGSSGGSFAGVSSTGGDFSNYVNQNIYFQINNIYYLLLAIFFLILLFILHKQRNLDSAFVNFLIVISILTIATFLLPTPLVDRYEVFILIFSPIFLLSFDMSNFKKIDRTYFWIIFGVLVICGAVIQILFLNVQINLGAFILRIILGSFSLIMG